MAQQRTKLLKRKQLKQNLELQALNSLRDNQDLIDAINFYITQPHLAPQQVNRLRAVLAVLSHAPLKKLIAFL